MEEGKSAALSDHEWESRILCSDESCIGVIGPNGRCKECGRPHEGPLPAATGSSCSAEPLSAEPAQEDESPGEERLTEEDWPGDADWEQRTLCSDESCIGVIGPDGRCKECGRPHQR